MKENGTTQVTKNWLVTLPDILSIWIGKTMNFDIHTRKHHQYSYQTLHPTGLHHQHKQALPFLQVVYRGRSRQLKSKLVQANASIWKWNGRFRPWPTNIQPELAPTKILGQYMQNLHFPLFILLHNFSVKLIAGLST